MKLSPLVVRLHLGVAVAMSAGMAWCGAAEVVTVAGSSTVKPIVDDATAQYAQEHSDVRFYVGGGGSNNGIKLVGEKRIDIGMASRALKDSEKQAHPDLTDVHIARDGIGVIVNAMNPVSELTSDQVRKIYVGQITNWSELGGPNAPIEVVGILLSHGTADVFEEQFGLEARQQDIGGKHLLSYRAADAEAWSPTVSKAVDGNPPSCAAVLSNSHAIGVSAIGQAETLVEAGAPIKLLVIDGMTASSGAVADGSYTISRRLLVMHSSNPKEEVRRFIEFLQSPQGHEIIRRHGYMPVKDE